MGSVRAAVPVCAALIALAVAGCGGSSASSSSSGSAGQTPSTSGSGPATTAGGGATTAGGITKAGAKLAVGQTATVPYKSPDSVSNAPPPYRLQVTVVSITKASFSDFKGIQLDATEKAGTPYYLRFKMTNVGSGDLGNPGGAISGVDNTGQDASSVTFLGSFPPCDYKVPPKPFTHNKTWSTCSVYLAPGGITSVHYNGFVPSYIESPVTWR
jgi:hypothetical protein